jgi:hypothetical protein
MRSDTYVAGFRVHARVASVFIPGISSAWGFSFPATPCILLEGSAQIAMKSEEKLWSGYVLLAQNGAWASHGERTTCVWKMEISNTRPCAYPRLVLNMHHGLDYGKFPLTGARSRGRLPIMGSGHAEQLGDAVTRGDMQALYYSKLAVRY